jgi:raffinose/stachyose/melibiose transport system permease protein
VRGLAALALPAFLLYGVFVLVALALAIGLSFTHWPVGGSVSFAGLANWRAFFLQQGPHTLVVTGEVIGISLLVQIPLSIMLGIFTAGRQRYRAVLSWIYVLPLLISPTGIAITWSRLFDPTFGGLSGVLTQTWLSNSTTAPILVTLIFSWRIVPFYMILVQAAVRTIPRELSEAAVLDGASRAAEIRHVILPQLRHTIVVVSILAVTGALTAFDLYYVMTGGGPDGATTTLSVGVYLKAFADQVLGAASVYAVVVAAVGVIFAATVSRVTGFGAMRSERE